MDKRRRTRTFPAEDEQGQPYTVHVYTDFNQLQEFGKPSYELEGMSELRLATGEHLNRVAKGEYEVVETGKKLKSQSPDIGRLRSRGNRIRHALQSTIGGTAFGFGSFVHRPFVSRHIGRVLAVLPRYLACSCSRCASVPSVVTVPTYRIANCVVGIRSLCRRWA